MKILRPFTGTGGIFFPIGLPPKGTCQFSTEICRKMCYATETSLFDFETFVPEEDKWQIYNYFIKQPVTRICNEILHELDGLQTPILHWFGTGDCQTKDIDRICLIIDNLPKHLVQMGFTRNKKLWRKYKKIFALTVESMDEIGSQEGMFSVPNYKEGISVMYSPDYAIRGGYCGPITCRDLIDSDLEHFVNCQVCRHIKAGCFDRQ